MENERKQKTLTRRQFVKYSAGLTIAAGLGLEAISPIFANASQSKKKMEKVTIGYLPICDAAPLLVAHAKGFYEEEGLDVEKPFLMRNWSALSEAFMSGQVNLCHLLSPIPIYMRYKLNFPVKVVAFDHLNGSAITVKDNSDIKHIGDLGGKQIAVPYWYSIHNVILQLALRKSGIEPVIQDRNKPLNKNQTNLFIMMPPDMPTALSAGAIDGYIVAEPFNAAGEVLAGGRILRFTGDIWKNHACCQAVISEERIKANPAWAQAVTNAIVKAEAWLKDNRQEAAKILSKEGAGYLPFPEKIINRAMDKYDAETYGKSGAIKHQKWETKRISFHPYPFKSYTVKLVELLKETKIEGDSAFLKTLNGEKVADELFDYGLIKTAIEKLGGMGKFASESHGANYNRTEVIEV